jgi:nucleotide-binding universal stress UspA family protein
MASTGLRQLVAIDFSPESLRALRAARLLNARAGGTLTIFHVRPPSDVRAAILEERGDLLKSSPATLKKAIDEHYRARLSRIVGHREAESWKVAKGKPALEIAREARRGSDLIAAGTRGAGAAARLILGSTVQELFQLSPVPVMVSPRK